MLTLQLIRHSPKGVDASLVPDEAKVAADLLRDHNFDEQADALLQHYAAVMHSVPMTPLWGRELLSGSLDVRYDN